MAIDFPNSPSLNQSFTAGGSTWIWDGIAWTLQRITTGAQGPQGEVGPQGPAGPTGPQGTSINVKASVATVALLPSSGNSANDARIVDADGVLYIWGGTSWTSAGQIVGPQGPQGPSNPNAATANRLSPYSWQGSGVDLFAEVWTPTVSNNTHRFRRIRAAAGSSITVVQASDGAIEIGYTSGGVGG